MTKLIKMLLALDLNPTTAKMLEVCILILQSEITWMSLLAQGL